MCFRLLTNHRHSSEVAAERPILVVRGNIDVRIPSSFRTATATTYIYLVSRQGETVASMQGTNKLGPVHEAPISPECYKKQQLRRHAGRPVSKIDCDTQTQHLSSHFAPTSERVFVNYVVGSDTIYVTTRPCTYMNRCVLSPSVGSQCFEN